MVFRRRKRLSLWQLAIEGVWPRAGWRRVFEYVKHRIRRLPDTPERVGRGIWCGVFASFSPFVGLHFVVALILAKPMRGNLLASIVGTWFGNPLTILPIGFVSLHTGYWLLGDRPEDGMVHALPRLFAGAGEDLWHNAHALFGPGRPDWDRLVVFYHEVFVPYFIGGMIPGVISATICYYLTVPLVAAYQNRRRKQLRDKLAQLQRLRAPGYDGADQGPDAT